MAADAEAAFGQIHILVNNAGCNIRKPALEVTWDNWNQILETNLRGTFFVAQAIARGMIANGYGRIVNIGSVTSVFGYAGLAPYGASRGGVRQLTMSLADEWGKSRRHGELPGSRMVQDRAKQGSLRKSGVGGVHHRSHSCKTPWPAARSGWRGCLSRLRIEPLRHRPDAAGGWRHFDGLGAGHRGSAKVTLKAPQDSSTITFAIRMGSHEGSLLISYRSFLPCLHGWRLHARRRRPPLRNLTRLRRPTHCCAVFSIRPTRHGRACGGTG